MTDVGKYMIKRKELNKPVISLLSQHLFLFNVMVFLLSLSYTNNFDYRTDENNFLDSDSAYQFYLFFFTT